jgi:hypothetical protein
VPETFCPGRTGARANVRRVRPMHDELWAGIALKLEYARFHLDRMWRSLEPPERTQMNVALEASGAIIDTGWQRSFYPYFDAFLTAARSVPEIINACFGADPGSRSRRTRSTLRIYGPVQRSSSDVREPPAQQSAKHQRSSNRRRPCHGGDHRLLWGHLYRWPDQSDPEYRNAPN